MSAIIDVVAPRLLAPAVMVAAAIIVKGYTDVGDGFSAGVIVQLSDNNGNIERLDLPFEAVGPADA